MCKQCELKPVYEFTNKRKLCKRCFINYFQKKVLYTLKKFNMIKRKDVIGYKKNNDFRTVVLEDVLKMFSDKSGIEIVKLPNKRATKITTYSSLDSESEDIVEILIHKNVSELKDELPIGDIIKPLYLFLDEEILLYAKLRNLKFKKAKEEKNNISRFLDKTEEKHPEVKRAIINGILKIYELG